MKDVDEKWMVTALEAARQARSAGEVPIGACLVGENGELLATGANLTITTNDPTAHAEIVAIRAAAAAIGNYRLTGLNTLLDDRAVCAMCAGAIVNARIKRLVFGARDERYGGVETHFGIGLGEELNHRFELTSGVLVDECRSLIQDFFRERRK